MRTGLIAYKMGMTRIFDEKNKHVPVTVLKIDNCKVVDVKTKDRDGYMSVQLGAGQKKESRISKPLMGHLKKSGATPKTIREFRVSDDCVLNIGDEILPSHFVKGQFVDVCAKSIGKGFAGAMKRWNFAGMEATHGVSVSHRAHGSTGQCQDPGKVFKGKKMAGHMGDAYVTIQNLVVVEADDENGYILVRGAVPGGVGAAVCVYDAVKRKLPEGISFPAAIKAAAKKVASEEVKEVETVSAEEVNVAAEQATDKE